MENTGTADVGDGASNVSDWRQMGRELRHIADDLRRSTPSLVSLAIRSLSVLAPRHVHHCDRTSPFACINTEWLWNGVWIVQSQLN